MSIFKIMSQIPFTAAVAFMMLVILASCHSKDLDETAGKNDSIEHDNNRMPKKKFDEKGSVDRNKNSHSGRISLERKYEFPEVY